MDFLVHVGPLVLAGLALGWVSWRFRKVSKSGQRYEKLGWGAAVLGGGVYFVFLAIRTTDVGPSQYVRGEVTSVGRTTRPPAARVELTRGAVEVPYVTVRVKDENLTVVGRYFEIGQRVCVHRNIGRWSRTTYLDVVDDSKCRDQKGDR